MENMAKRLIDSCISQSSKWNGLKTHFSKLLYLLFIVHADPWGRGSADAYGIKMRLCPGFKENDKDIETAKVDIDKSGLVKFYEIDGNQYYEVSQWDRFQNFNVKNRGFSPRYVPPPSVTVKHCETQKPLDELSLVDFDYEKNKIIVTGHTTKRHEPVTADTIFDRFQISWQKNIGKYLELYKSCDLQREHDEIQKWIFKRPTKAKRYKDWNRFAHNWLKNADEKATPTPKPIKKKTALQEEIDRDVQEALKL